MREFTLKRLAAAAMLGGTLFLSLPMDATIVNDYKDARRVVLSANGEKMPIKVTITPTNGNSLYNYSGTDENGDEFLFKVLMPFTSQEDVLDDNGNPTGETQTVVDNSKIILTGINTTAQYVTTPDEVVISDGNDNFKVPVENILFIYGDGYAGFDHWNDYINEYSFNNANSLGRVFLSENVKKINWEGYFDVRNSDKAPRDFHFISNDIPSMSMNEGIGSQIRIYVPNNLRETYTEGIKSQVTTSVWGEDMAPVTVNVTSSGTLATLIYDYVDNLEDITHLVITGTPNEDDCRLFRRMPYLEILDLSAVTGLESVTGCNNLAYLREVKLPDCLKMIGDNAFEECTALTDINIPEGVTRIGQKSFYNTTSLTAIELPESLRIIDSYAFNYSGIQAIDLKNVESIEYYAFSKTPIKDVDWGTKLKRIDGWAFYDCNQLEKVILPEGLNDIGSYAFYYCSNIKEISIPSTVTYFDTSALRYNYELQTVSVKILFPVHGDEPFKELNGNCVLYVPALTLNEYMTSDVFRNFRYIKPMEEDLIEITIRDREYNLVSDKGISEKADLTLCESGHLKVSRIAPLSLNDYCQNDTTWSKSTFIAQSEVVAEKVAIKKSLETNRWYFLSFPFDVKVKDIEVDKDALWVVRRYNGENRAAMNEGKSTWENMTDNDVLKAGEGYIFHCAKENGSDVSFTFRPAKDGNGNAYFAKDDVVKSLNEYPSEFPHNASWNLVGNSFPAYLNLKAVDFDGPVTIYTNKDDYWNWRYEAYSPLDDELVLEPFQAFFVQKQEVETGAQLILKPEGRAHSVEACQALYETEENLTRASADRALFNLNIKGENGTDRTRLVVNEEASAAYESNRDASKFPAMNAETPQIFMLNNGMRMAIDEQPLGNGSFPVGTKLQKGTYSISLTTRRADNFEAFLLDSKTGVETNLSKGDCTFESDGNDEARFTLAVRPLPLNSGVEENVSGSGISVNVNGNILSVVAPSAIPVSVIAADGMTLISQVTDSLSTELHSGIYIVKAGEKVVKVVVGK
ncbi:MAG: leucine-rich repeat domain-containing protein [Muribaculaceae bacterium]|nr:leucine-rich repeat domain-containing protein [Muribaculaceae bacterium]